MRLLPKRPGTGVDATTTDAEVADAVDASRGAPGRPKGRPTPKRRDSVGQRGPAAPPPKTRKEAYRWQKEQTARSKAVASAGPKLSKEAYREALRKGDPSVLPRRDQGPLKALARDYVDSRRMFSNFLLLAFLLILFSSLIKGLSFIAVLVLVITVVEWYITGRRLKKIAAERNIETRESAMGIGFYAGSRAYMPRKWRLPAPRKTRGDTI